MPGWLLSPGSDQACPRERFLFRHSSWRCDGREILPHMAMRAKWLWLDIGLVSITTGGVLEAWGPLKSALNEVMQEVRSVPADLHEPRAVRAWLAGALPETITLVRDYLPTKSKAYPSETLAAEVEALRQHLLGETATE